MEQAPLRPASSFLSEPASQPVPPPVPPVRPVSSPVHQPGPDEAPVSGWLAAAYKPRVPATAPVDPDQTVGFFASAASGGGVDHDPAARAHGVAPEVPVSEQVVPPEVSPPEAVAEDELIGLSADEPRPIVINGEFVEFPGDDVNLTYAGEATVNLAYAGETTVNLADIAYVAAPEPTDSGSDPTGPVDTSTENVAGGSGTSTTTEEGVPQAGPVVDPNFTPANEVEENLLAAVGGGSTDTFLSTLLLARVLLPVAADSVPGTHPGAEGFTWRTEDIEGEPYVVAYTSVERLVDRLGDVATDTVQVKFAQLIRRWPNQAWSFAINPGTPVGATLPGGQIVALANWAAEVGLGDDDVAEPAPATTPATRTAPARAAADPAGPMMMQKAVAPAQLDYYLDRGYDRVSGFVNRAHEVAHLNTPALLYAALGLGYPGSPFTPDAPEVYVLRWPVHRPSLYRIPYGGQNETAMRAMEGWVIERPPFRGNGFAPGESSDVIAEFKVDSTRLPHGAELWRFTASGAEELVATLDSDTSTWQRVEAG